MEASLNFKPVHLKIMVLLDKMGVLSSRRIAEIFDIARDTAELKIEYLEGKGFVRIHGMKLFRKGREANLWELTEEGKSFVNAAREKGELPGIKLSEINETVLAVCKEIIRLLEKPSSFDELSRNLKASGIKIREYKIGDILRLLEIFGMIKKVQGPKEIKVHRHLGIAALSSLPAGIIVFVKAEGADLYSAEF
jgi:hypothetical protein